jgi:hypothetical protein
MLKPDCASGPLVVIFDGNVCDLSPESRDTLQELLRLGVKPLSGFLEHYGSWEAVAQAFAADFDPGIPPLDA